MSLPFLLEHDTIKNIMKTNIKKSLYIIFPILLILSSLYIFKTINIQGTELKTENWKETKIENLTITLPDRLIAYDDISFNDQKNNIQRAFVMRKTVSEDNIYQNIDNWYISGQERGFFWVRYFEINNTPAFIVRQEDFDEVSSNFQTIKFMDMDKNFYDIVLRGFSDAELEYFVENIEFTVD